MMLADPATLEQPKESVLACSFRSVLVVALGLGMVCAAPSPARSSGEISLVESSPVETSLGFPEVPDAWEVWPEMIGSAVRRVDLAAFYVSGEPGSRLDATLAALRDAGARGVDVRILADAGFYRTYSRDLDDLDRALGVRVRLIDFRELAGGPMHAKYFLVDGRDAYVGSQNFDYRALEHIHEIGLRLRLPAYARALGRVFERDWAAARPLGIDPEETEDAATASLYAGDPVPDEGIRLGDPGRDGFILYPAFSPRGEIPEEREWDLPRIEELMTSARDSLSVTCMTYNPAGRDGTYWEVMENQLRFAAARGVRVRVMVSDWGKTSPKIDFLKSLQCVPGIEVRLVSIPEASTGFIPFARVTHAKYLTVDGGRCWVGTSNWEKSYFYSSRNVGMVLESRSITGALDRDFLQLWNSPYAETVDPGKTYVPRRVAD